MKLNEITNMKRTDVLLKFEADIEVLITDKNELAMVNAALKGNIIQNINSFFLLSNQYFLN
jgi:hypothetical protein